jgi:hypothetical protein
MLDPSSFLDAHHRVCAQLVSANKLNAELQDKLHNANAQLALAATFIARLQRQLAHKEKKQGSENQILFGDGLPRILSDPEVRERVREKQQAKEQARVEKVMRQRTRQYNTARRKAENAAWERAKQAHDHAVKAWAAEVEKAKAGGIPKKDWPKKPKCPLKKDVSTAVTEAQILSQFVEDDGEWIDMDLENTEGEFDVQDEA